MRTTDVKTGVVLFFVIVLVGGGYYFSREKQDEPIDLAAGTGTATKLEQPATTAPPAGRAAPSKAPPAEKQPDRNRAVSPARRTTNGDTATRVRQPAGDASNRGAVGNGRRANLRTAQRSPSPGTEAAETAARRRASKDERAAARRVPPPGTAADRAADGRKQDTPTRPRGDDAEAPKTAPSATSPPPAAGSAAVDKHRVQPGDTLRTIAEIYYGDPALESLLRQHNRNVTDPNRLTAGSVIRIPPAPSSRATSRPAGRTAGEPSAATAHPRTYTVQSGDSFYSIARDVLGDATRWQELFDLNKAAVNGNAKSLQIGQVIALPAP